MILLSSLRNYFLILVCVIFVQTYSYSYKSASDDFKWEFQKHNEDFLDPSWSLDDIKEYYRILGSQYNENELLKSAYENGRKTLQTRALQKRFIRKSEDEDDEDENGISSLQMEEDYVVFIDRFDEALNSYSVQKKLKDLDPNTVLNQLKIRDKNGILALKNTGIYELINKLGDEHSDFIEYSKRFENFNLNKNLAKRMRILLISTLVDSLKCIKETFKNGEEEFSLICKGRSIKMSDLNEYIKTLKTEVQKIGSIEVHALHNFFIDADFEFNRTLTFFAFAPNWDIIVNNSKQHRLIRLNGSKPEQFNNTALKAEGEGANGIAGQHGTPGIHGGSFVGVGQVFNNAELLRIETRGGSGSNGQNASDGNRGKNANHSDFNGIFNGLSKSNAHHILHQNNLKPYAVTGWKEDFHFFWWYDFDAYCQKGQDGGHGGKGGEGGYGGLPGIIEIIGLGSEGINEKVEKVFFNGTSGNSGKGANGGQYGETEPAFIIRYETSWVDWFGSVSEIKSGHKPSLSQKCENNLAEHGKSDFIESNKTKDEPKAPQLKTEFADAINRYKGYILENVLDSIYKTSLTGFLRNISNSSKLNSFYDTKTFVKEASILEGFYFNMHHDFDFTDTYTLFEERLKDYSNNTFNKPKNESETEDSDDKVLCNYLYSTIVTKIWSIKRGEESFLITDIEKFLESAKNDVDRYKDVDKQMSGAKEILKQKEEHQKTIKQGSKNVDVLLAGVDEDIKELTRELNKLVEAAKKKGAEAEDKATELANETNEEHALGPLSAVLGVLSVVSKVVAVVGVVVPVAGPFIAAGAAGAGMMIDFAKKQIEPTPLNEDDNHQQLNDLADNIDAERKQLSDLMLNNDTAAFDKIIEKLGKKIFQTIPPTLTLPGSEFARTFSSKIKKLTNMVPSGLVNMASVAGDVSSGIIDLQNQAKMQTELAKSKADKVNEFRKQSHQFKKLANNIQSNIMPGLCNFADKFKNMKGQLFNMTVLDLDMFDNKIKNALSEGMTEISNSAKSLDTGTEMLVGSFTKLSSSMNAVIEMIKTVKAGESNVKAAETMAAISSPNALNRKIENKELEYAMLELDRLTKCTIVLTKFNRALNAFKMVIFPFGEEYMSRFRINKELKLTNKVENMVAEAIDKIYELRSMVMDKSAQIERFDEYVFNNAVFESDENNVTTPFFTWRSSVFKGDIRNLLMGYPTVFIANVAEATGKNAIKFNEIGIRFKASNKLVQDAIDLEITNFGVTMSYSGKAYYRCGTDYYTMSSSQYDITYLFKRDDQGVPVYKNVVYDKFKSGDPVVSPYAIWTFQLFSVVGSSTDVFKALQKYNTLVDIELVGRGQYVSYGVHHAQFCTNLDQFYKLDNSLTHLIQKKHK